MEKIFDIINNSKLFSGVNEFELADLIICISPKTKTYKKDDTIYRAGDCISSVALLLEGQVHIQKEDFWGNLSILNAVFPGEIFGEAFACLEGEPMTYNAVAAEYCIVTFIDIQRILTTCSSACKFHARLIQNLLSAIADKNRILTQKMLHIQQRSTRDKLLSYLSEQSLKHGSPAFDISFNRRQLADFLSVDRCAMSTELSKMRAEGILDYDRNHFILKSQKSDIT